MGGVWVGCLKGLSWEMEYFLLLQVYFFFAINLCLSSVFKVQYMYVCFKVWLVDDKGEERRKWNNVPVWFGSSSKTMP